MKVTEHAVDAMHQRAFLIEDEPGYLAAVTTLLHHWIDPTRSNWFRGLKDFRIQPSGLRNWLITLSFHSQLEAEAFEPRQPEDENGG